MTRELEERQIIGSNPIYQIQYVSSVIFDSQIQEVKYGVPQVPVLGLRNEYNILK